ncbi:Neuronal cell adhesion molecule [Trichoplax sp. H2]|nr:Neuronal cell adhesion molecule [Trichoplax sp. H2]|eukprot:RDD40653.1 Neuronal cell adhesion molecule [Trichoplax sp. H2]
MKLITTISLLFLTTTVINAITAPTIIIQPVDFINENAISRTGSDNLVVPCEATGAGTISYVWQHNGKNIQYDARIKLSGGNLTFTGIIPADAGKYTCLASNLYGTSISREATLQVRILEKLGVAAEVFTIDINGNARLRCQISEKNLPRPNVIYWTDANNVRLTETNSIAQAVYAGDLIFIAGWPNNTGSYQCTVKWTSNNPNTGSSEETKYVGTFQYVNFTTNTATTVTPKIAVAPNAPVALLGQARVVLECIATGYPVPNIRWQKKSGTLPTNRYAIEKFGRHLVIKNIQTVDAGDYQCTAISGSSQVTATTTLKVTIDSRWITPITDTNQPVESDFVWPCSVSGSNIKYRWYMNGQQIVASSRYVLNSNGSLTIRNLAREDTKVYTCVGYNDHSNVASSGYLNVTVAAPVFTEKPYTQTTLFRGQTSTIRCTVTGGPRPVMTYTRNGGFVDTLLYNKYTVLLNGNLIIHNVDDNDAGTYMCTARNRYGSSNVSGIAIVVSATVFSKPLVKTSVRRPQNFSISCAVTKAVNYNVALYWQRNNVNITTSRATITTSGLTTTLTYVNTTLTDTGTFSCVAATFVPFVGYVPQSSSALLTVNDAPDPPFSFTYSQLISSAVVLSWLPGSPNNSPLLRFTILYRVNSVDAWRIAQDYIPVSTTFRRVTLSPFNTYRFKVVAVNAVGTSKDSAHLVFSTSGARPSYAPGEFRANGVASDPTAIDISFKPLSREEQNDAGIGYKLYYRTSVSTSTWVTLDINTGGSYRLTGLLQSTTYELQLQPFNNAGLGIASTPVIKATTGSSPPTAAPTSIKAYVISTSTVKITWNKISSVATTRATAVGYRISYWIYDNSIANTSTFGDINTATIEGLSAYFTYSFRINAYTSGGDGPFSSTITAYTNNPVPDAVTGLKVTESVKSQVVVQWVAPAIANGITQYQIQYAVLNASGIAGPYSTYNTVNAETTFTFNNMAAGNYIFTVTPKNANGYGVPSDIRSPVNGLGPAAPTLFKVVSIEQTAIDFEWVASENPTNGFIIQYRVATSQGAFVNASTTMIAISVRRYKVTGLLAATSYICHVIAISNNIFSLPSNQVNATTAAIPGAQTPFYQEVWFIALVSASGILLVFLVLVCFIRSDRKKKNGGRYFTPSDNEKKPDVPPLPADEPEEEVKRPPLPEDNHHTEDNFRHSDVEVDSVDSMDQYADLPHLSKFNEDGSFINAYGGLSKRNSTTDTTSFMGNYSEARFDGNASFHGGSYAPTLRSSYPGSPANTINPNQSAFSTFV